MENSKAIFLNQFTTCFPYQLIDDDEKYFVVTKSVDRKIYGYNKKYSNAINKLFRIEKCFNSSGCDLHTKRGRI
jgi:hypothetical protein